MAFYLDNLYNTSTTVTLPDGREIKVSALGEMQMRQRDMMARVEAAKYRKKLRAPDSDENLVFLSSLSELKDEDLRDLLVSMYTQLEATDEARSQVKPVFVPTPDNATDEEKLDAVDNQEVADKETEEKFQTVLKELSESYKESIQGWDREKLITEAKEWTVRSLSYTEFLRNSVLASIYLATEYKNKRMFSSLADVDNCNRDVVDMIYKAFISVNNKDSWEIAKEALRGN